MPQFRDIVTSAEELARIIGVPSELVLKKQLPELDAHMRRFIAESPFVLLGTVGRDGACDVSPRGNAPGLATVLDARTLLIPERRGNRRADSLRNIIETGRAGLLFLIPGVGETLRVNGRAFVIRDDEVLAPLAVGGSARSSGSWSRSRSASCNAPRPSSGRGSGTSARPAVRRRCPAWPRC